MTDETGELARLADQMILGVLAVTPRLEVERANAAAHALLGRRPGSLLGRSVMETFVDHGAEEAVRAAIGGSATSFELDGPEDRRLVVRARRAASGGAWILIEDVTELRRLRRIRAEFIDNLSHELRTPLTTVRLLTERLMDELESLDVPPKVRERVRTIDVETGHLTQMVNELLDLSRIEQAATQLHLEDVAVGPLVEGALGRLATFADRQGVVLRAELPAVGDLPAVRGDTERLSQLMVNLLHNAVKFSAEGGVVTVHARAVGSEVHIAVEDEGIGIPRADQARVFERFYKVDRARDRGAGGTGLGLAIARHIAEAHGGRLWLDSEEGRGSTFTLALSIVEEP